MLPFHSHYISVFGVAEYYRALGYKVFFTGTAKLQKLVEEQGFSFKEFDYPSEDVIMTSKAFWGTILKSLSDQKFVINRYKRFLRQRNNFYFLYNSVSPDLIFIDEHMAECALFYKEFSVNISIINTKFSTRKAPGIPPLCSAFQADGSYISNCVSKLLWLRHQTAMKINERIQKIAFLSYDETFFWERYSKCIGVEWSRVISRENSYYRTVKGLTTYVVAPKALEYSFKTYFANEKYIYFPFKRKEDINSYDYTNLIDLIKQNKKKIKVIGCAFGTISGNWYEELNTFYVELMKATSYFPNVIFVFSNHGFNLRNFNEQKNIKIIEYLPVLDFLKYCDGFISHGGLTTIKECFDAKVPMLLFPMNQNSDNLGNAVRIVANGYGVMGKFRKDRYKNIIKHIDKILSINVKWS